MGNEASSGVGTDLVVKWSKLATGGTTPTARDGHVFVSSAGHTKAYLFGGMLQQLTETDDFHVSTFPAISFSWQCVADYRQQPLNARPETVAEPSLVPSRVGAVGMRCSSAVLLRIYIIVAALPCRGTGG